MSNARNLANLLGTGTQITTADIADGVFQANKNLIINGAMEIDQRYSGTGPNTVTGGGYNVDRFGMYYSGNSWTTQQSTVAPDGFKNSLLMTVTGTSTPVYSFFGQRIEGVNSAQLGFGTSWAKTITVSFWVRSSVAGIYSIAITNGASDRAYAVQYTINSANTWEYKTATIPGDTTGTWLTNNANGLYVRFNLGSASARLISAGSWQVVNADGATGSTGADSWATTSGATFYMTGVQLEVGDTATPFEHRSYGDELARCQRYLYMLDTTGNAGDENTPVFREGATAAQLTYYLPTNLRTTPSITGSDYGRVVGYDTSFNVVTAAVSAMGIRTNINDGQKIDINITHSSFGGGYVFAHHDRASSGAGNLAFDAEL